MKKINVFTLIFGLFISAKCISQTSNDIGIGLTTDSDQRLFLDYKLALKNNRSMNFRLSQGWFKDEDFVGSGFSQPDSTGAKKYEVSYLTHRILQSKLIIGPEFRIKESNFSWGIEGILGYRLETSTINKYSHDFVNSSATPTGIILLYPHTSSVVSEFYKREYLTTGVQGRFSVKAMATERLGIKLFCEIGLDYNIRVSNISEFAEDPVPMPDPMEVDAILTFPKNYLIPRLRLGTSIFLTYKKLRSNS